PAGSSLVFSLAGYQPRLCFASASLLASGPNWRPLPPLPSGPWPTTAMPPPLPLRRQCSLGTTPSCNGARPQGCRGIEPDGSASFTVKTLYLPRWRHTTTLTCEQWQG